jgi:PPOX class probable F420-dependent enzyme
MSPTPLDILARTPYVLLTTFRRTGEPVATAVWSVRDGDRLLIWSNIAAGKVKRVRRTSRVLIGPCTRTGQPTGEPVEGLAELLDEAGLGRVVRLLKQKYWSARLLLPMTDLGVRLGQNPGHAAIAVTLSG